MSSAHEEADDGPAFSYNYEEFDGSSSTEIPRDLPYHDHKKIPARLRDSYQGDGEPEEEEDSLSADGHASLDDNTHLHGEQSGTNVVIHDSTPEIGRPSSADGSLSIPDDTPSIQVSRRSTHSEGQSNSIRAH